MVFPMLLPLPQGPGPEYRRGGWPWLLAAAVFVLAWLAFGGWLMTLDRGMEKPWLVLPAMAAWCGILITVATAFVMKGMK